MNKIMLVSRVLLPFVLAFCFFGANASNGSGDYPGYSEDDMKVVDRLNNLNSVVKVRYTKEVKDRINDYVKTYPKGAEKILGRVSLYFPLVESEIRSRNLPEDLKYLAVVESALRPSAKSKSGAAGLWQFMKGTGRMYGLTINNEIDERCDAIKSTRAALNYLEDLNNQFKDWTLALAAYNCGPGNVRKAIRKSGGNRDYWEIRSYLPAETRQYVPRFIAASYLMQYHYMHDISPEVLNSDISNTTTLKISKYTSLDKLSSQLGVSLDDLKFLNPAYLKAYVPSSNKANYLTIPAKSLNYYLGYEANFDQIVFTLDKNGLKYKDELRRVKSLDLLPRLKSATYNRNALILRNVEVSPMRTSLSALSNATEIRRDFYIYHELKKRESLYDLVKKYEGVTLESLMVLNDFDTKQPPVIGSMIKIKRR